MLFWSKAINLLSIYLSIIYLSISIAGREKYTLSGGFSMSSPPHTQLKQLKHI